VHTYVASATGVAARQLLSLLLRAGHSVVGLTRTPGKAECAGEGGIGLEARAVAPRLAEVAGKHSRGGRAVEADRLE
jgi:hypothetical protein